MHLLTISINAILLTIGLSFHFTSYIIKSQIIDNNIFNFYFGLIIAQTILIGFYLQFIKEKDERGIPIDKIIASLSSRTRYILIFLLIVSAIIVVYSISLMSGGGPDLIDGNYVLIDKGRIIKEISYEDYLFFNLLTFRINSIVAIFFNIFDIILFNYIFKRSSN